MKFLFLSRYPADILDRVGIDQSLVSFMPKPVSPAQLLGRIRNILDAPPEDHQVQQTIF